MSGTAQKTASRQRLATAFILNAALEGAGREIRAQLPYADAQARSEILEIVARERLDLAMEALETGGDQMEAAFASRLRAGLHL